MIQNVPDTIYVARYPHRFFEKSKFLSVFANHGYEILERFNAMDGGNAFARWQGLIFKKTSS